MTKQKDGFNYLGLEFQERLLKQFLEDRKFTERIVDIIDPNYFTDDHLRLIAVTIKNAHEQHEAIPDVGSLKMRISAKVGSESTQKIIIGQIDRVVGANENDALFVQDMAVKFCKQQELVKSVRDIQKIIDRGDLEDYDQCADLIRRALEAGDLTEDDTNVLDGLAEVLSADYRKPISTGILGLDELMDGGLSRGELGLILAPFGVGKTTMITKLASAAKEGGNNVLQIIFEDNPKVIKRKHLSCWTKIPLNELADEQWRPRLEEEIKRQTESKGTILIKKFSSDGITIPKIRQYIKKKISQGFRPDMILLDYIDCVQPSKEFKDVYAGEGNVMRQYETLLSDFDVAGWTAVQGNRSSIGAEVVEADQMGGSIKKGQIGHFIVSIAKTNIQKETGTATMAILKSRFGKDGIIFHDITFDNATIQIDVTKNNSGQSFMQNNVEKAADAQDKISAVMTAVSDRKREEDRVKMEEDRVKMRADENNIGVDQPETEDVT